MSFESNWSFDSKSLISGTFDNRAFPFQGMSQRYIDGASKIKHWIFDNFSYFVAANFWDGFNRAVLSPIYRIDDISNGTFAVVQRIPTNGARDWAFLTIPGSSTSFVAIANFVGNSYIYKWNGPRDIRSFAIPEPGSGYLDGDVVLRGSSRLLARFTVDGPIGSVLSMKPNAEANITGCAIAIFTGMQVVYSTATMRCEVGSRIISDSELSGYVSAVTSSQGRIVNITLENITKAYAKNPSLKLDPKSKAADSCTCLLGDWNKCIVLTGIPNTLKIVPKSGIGGFSGSVIQVSGSGSIITASVDSAGSGYSDDFDIDVEDVSSLNPKCICADSDGKSISWNKCIDIKLSVGAIKSVAALQTGLKYFADVEHEIVFSSAKTVMTGTVTQVAVKSNASSNCSLQIYSGFQIRSNSTMGCSAGTRISTNVSGSILEGIISSVDKNGSILGISLIKAVKVYGSDPVSYFISTDTISGNRSNSSEACTCLLGSWSNCLRLNRTKNRIKIIPSDGKGGFEAEVTEVDSMGSILAVSLINSGAGYPEPPSITATEEFQAGSPCQCGLDTSKTMQWSQCIRVVVAKNALIVPTPVRDVPARNVARKVLNFF